MKLPVQNFCEESQQSNLKVGVCVGVYSVVGLHHDIPEEVGNMLYMDTGINIASTDPSLLPSPPPPPLFSPLAMLSASLDQSEMSRLLTNHSSPGGVEPAGGAAALVQQPELPQVLHEVHQLVAHPVRAVVLGTRGS